MKKIFRQIHLWLSIPFGLIISVICFTGAALVFETEITERCHRERYFVAQVGEKTVPVNELLEKVASTLPDSVAITGVSISADPRRTYQIALSKPRRASVYVDPYTAQITGKSERGAFFTFMFRMHRWLLDSMKPEGGPFVGKVIVGISTLMMVIILLSGIVIWIPRTRKAFNNRWKVSTRKGWRRFWFDLHLASGMYTSVLLLALALTGLTWSFSWYRNAFYQLFGVEVQQNTAHATSKQEKRSHASAQGEREHERQSPFAHWQQVYQQLSLENNGFQQITITNGAAKVAFDRWGNQRAADSYSFHPQSGEITQTTVYADQEKATKIRGWIYSVHVGNWGGLLTRLLTFVAALLGGMLPLTGYYLWIKKKRRKKGETT